MKYCILIHISRDKISFSYNREDGDNRFIPYGDEPEKPLAICYQGNDIQIGNFALQEAMHGKPNAYTNIFDTIQNTETIEFRGEKCDINKLLFFAIERYLAEFFDKILLRQKGSLIENRAKLPIALLFDPDLKDYERGYIKSSLINGGYGHIEEENYNNSILNVYEDKIRSNNQAAIFVAGNGFDLFCQVIGENIKSEIKMAGVGKDPRSDKAVDSIKKDIILQGYDPYHSNKEFDLEIISKIVSNFLLSGKREKEGTFQLSDGNGYDYFLSLSELYGNSSNISDEYIRAFSELKGLLEDVSVDKTKCSVFLVDKESSNEYIESLFVKESFPVFRLTEKEREKAKLLILNDIRQKDYNIGCNSNNVSVNLDSPDNIYKLFVWGKFKEAKERYRTLQGDFNEEIKLCNQCIREERELNITNVNVDEAKDILKRWSGYGITNIIIEPYREKIEAILKKGGKVGAKLSTSIQSKSDRIDDIIHSEIDNEARKLFSLGKFKEARDKYHNLKGDFSKEIADCNKCIRNLKELNVANDSTIHLILDEWKRLGISQIFIDKYNRKESAPQGIKSDVESKLINPKETRLEIADARQQILKGDKQGIILLDRIEEKLHSVSFHSLDDKINETRSLWNDKLTADAKSKTKIKSVKVNETSKDQKNSERKTAPVKQQNIKPISEREIRVRKAEALAQIRTGDLEKGRKNLLDLMSILKYMDFHKYDKELAEALTRTKK